MINQVNGGIVLNKSSFLIRDISLYLIMLMVLLLVSCQSRSVSSNKQKSKEDWEREAYRKMIQEERHDLGKTQW